MEEVCDGYVLALVMSWGGVAGRVDLLSATLLERRTEGIVMAVLPSR